MTPELYADFNNADARGRLRLNCAGTAADLARLGLRLREGMRVVLHDEELSAEGVVEYSADERVWVASVDWAAVTPPPVAPAASPGS